MHVSFYRLPELMNTEQTALESQSNKSVNQKTDLTGIKTKTLKEISMSNRKL